MCTCSNNPMNDGQSTNCGSDCISPGPFRAVKPGCDTSPNTGTIIPFSSGSTPVALATIIDDLIGLPWQIGFSSANPGVTIVGDTIDLTGIVTEAFSVPRAGNITAISAKFSTLFGSEGPLLGAVTITARIYRAPANSTVYTATSAAVSLAPSFSGLVTTGQTASGFANVGPIPVAQGDCLLMVYTLTGTNLSIAQTITGTASAGIVIS